MITAFLPCRKGSQRIPDKNIKKFGGIEGGLLSIKLKQLLDCPQIDEVIVSSNDIRILTFAEKLKNAKLKLDERPEHLGTSDTSTDDLIKYVPSIILEGDVLWTHVTSPFICASSYSSFIAQYIESLNNGFDSLMTVKELKGFIWSNDGPLNYQRETEKWPRTQTVQSLYEIDSGAFISSIENYNLFEDRIGSKPFKYTQDDIKSLDIDWPKDFDLAERIFLGMKNN